MTRRDEKEWRVEEGEQHQQDEQHEQHEQDEQDEQNQRQTQPKYRADGRTVGMDSARAEDTGGGEDDTNQDTMCRTTTTWDRRGQ